MMPQEIEMFKLDKYKDKSIRFYDKNDHYDLIFSSEFQGANQQSPVYADLLMDLKDADKSKQIHLWIHSCGGDCSTLMLIDQQLNEFEYVVTIGMGQIDSAGFMLWSKGDERYLSPLTLCMYHSLSTGNYGKASQMKEYSQFMTRYQSVFEQSAKNILTSQEIQKGRYTQIWMLGKELIQRGKALDFNKYSSRNVLQKLEAFKMGDDLYLKDINKNYIQIVDLGQSYNKKSLMNKYLFTLQKQEQCEKYYEEFGQTFIYFMNGWLQRKDNLLIKDGFISDSYLLQQWNQCIDQKITITQLKNKIQKWIKEFRQDLYIEKNAKKGNKSGIIIKEQ